MFSGLLPSKQMSFRWKPCSLENFLNKVNESLPSLFSSFFSPLCLLLLTKTKPVLVFCRFFLIITMNMTSVLFLLVVCIFITWVSVSTLIYIHILPHLDTFICVWFFLFVCLFCSSSDYVITFFVAVCENVDSTKKNSRQVGENLEKLLRPAETDNTDFNISLLFTLAKTF